MAVKMHSKERLDLKKQEQSSEDCKEVVLFCDPITSDCMLEDTSCDSSLVNGIYVYEDHLPAISWDANWAWTRRIHRLFVNSVRLQFMLAWSSTLGGAHSALGETITSHAEEAGMISRCQLALARRMGDDLLAARSKIYAAYSLMQRSRIHQAAKIVRNQYQYLTRDSAVRDKQLEDTCLSIWRRLQYLQRMKRPMITSPPSNEHHSPPSSPPASCATPSSPCATPTSSCATPTSPCTPISPQCTPPSSPVHHRSSPQSSPVSSGLPSSPRGSSSC